jgi:putative ABC transport system substrate-binding protein
MPTIDESYLDLNNGVITNGMVLSYLAVTERLPLVSTTPQWAQAGSLLGYGTNTLGVVRRVGYYISAIFKSAKPGDLAVELPTSFDLAINLRTAKVIGLTIPPSVLVQATQVIE